MKKYRITDADGDVYNVEEETIDEQPVEEVEEKEIVHDEDALTPDEIAALKRLAGIADQLIELLNVENKEHAATSDEGLETEELVPDPDEVQDGCDEEFEEKEEVIDTKAKDSFGSIETKKASVEDSLDDDVSAAWTKRYGG